LEAVDVTYRRTSKALLNPVLFKTENQNTEIYFFFLILKFKIPGFVLL
jgi:hypothetical protein